MGFYNSLRIIIKLKKIINQQCLILDRFILSLLLFLVEYDLNPLNPEKVVKITNPRGVGVTQKCMS